MVHNSYGYYGYSGNIWSNGKNQRYGPKFGEGDVMGCGVIDGNCFFTKNGDFLGVAYRRVPPGLYPTVGLGPFGTVNANFGQSPFRFNLDWETVRSLCSPSTRQQSPPATAWPPTAPPRART